MSGLPIVEYGQKDDCYYLIIEKCSPRGKQLLQDNLAITCISLYIFVKKADTSNPSIQEKLDVIPLNRCNVFVMYLCLHLVLKKLQVQN